MNIYYIGYEYNYFGFRDLVSNKIGCKFYISFNYVPITDLTSLRGINYRDPDNCFILGLHAEKVVMDFLKMTGGQVGSLPEYHFLNQMENIAKEMEKSRLEKYHQMFHKNAPPDINLSNRYDLLVLE